MIELQFLGGHAFADELIEWFSAGKLCHVDYREPVDRRLYGARSDVVGGAPAGVQWRDRSYANDRPRVVCRVPATLAELVKFYAFLVAQQGKPYDKTAILGFASGRDWRAPDSWFCSELIAAALEAADILARLYSDVSKITPVALALVLSSKPGVTFETIKPEKLGA